MISRRLSCRSGGSVGYDQRERVGARRALMDDLYIGKEGITSASLRAIATPQSFTAL